MSTKSSIYYDGDSDFHLYQEGFDSWNVRLDVPLGGGSEVTVVIPLRIWKEMRQTTMYMERYLDMSSENLRAEAEKSVDKRLAEWKDRGSDPKSILNFSGVVVYGAIESPRDEQIENYIRWYTPPSPSTGKPS